MMKNDLEMLVEQLDSALQEPQTPEEAFEIALLAGLLARLGPEHPLLSRAAEWRDGPGRSLLVLAWEDLELDAIEQPLLQVQEDDASDELLNSLFDYDEVCAAAAWCGESPRLEQSLELVLRTLRASPEPWRPLAPLAAQLLQNRPPLPGDPARLLWAAVECSAFRRGSLGPG